MSKKKVETLEEFLKRGGQIQKVEPPSHDLIIRQKEAKDFVKRAQATERREK